MRLPDAKRMDVAAATRIYELTLAAEPRVKPIILDAMRGFGLADVAHASQQVVEALSCQSRVWLTSDLHFGHSNILTYGARHHRDLAHMHRELTAMMHKVVDPSDTLVIAGDLLFGEDPVLLEDLASVSDRLILVSGNHDFDKAGRFRYPRQHFHTVVPFLFWHLEGQNCMVSHLPVPVEALPKVAPGSGAQAPMADQLVNFHGHLHLKAVPNDQPERIVHVNVGYDHQRGMLCL